MAGSIVGTAKSVNSCLEMFSKESKLRSKRLHRSLASMLAYGEIQSCFFASGSTVSNLAIVPDQLPIQMIVTKVNVMGQESTSNVHLETLHI